MKLRVEKKNDAESGDRPLRVSHASKSPSVVKDAASANAPMISTILVDFDKQPRGKGRKKRFLCTPPLLKILGFSSYGTDDRTNDTGNWLQCVNNTGHIIESKMQ